MSNLSLPARETDPPFSHKSGVSITHEQNIICRQLFVGHVVSARLMKRKEKIHQKIIINYWTRSSKISWFVGEQINYLPMPKAEPSTNHNILREPSSIIVLSFTYQASFYIFLYSFSESSAKRAAIVYKVEANAHAQSIICSWGTFLTNAHAQTIICTQLFAGKLANQNWENNKVNDNNNYCYLWEY